MTNISGYGSNPYINGNYSTSGPSGASGQGGVQQMSGSSPNNGPSGVQERTTVTYKPAARAKAADKTKNAEEQRLRAQLAELEGQLSAINSEINQYDFQMAQANKIKDKADPNSSEYKQACKDWATAYGKSAPLRAKKVDLVNEINSIKQQLGIGGGGVSGVSGVSGT